MFQNILGCNGEPRPVYSELAIGTLEFSDQVVRGVKIVLLSYGLICRVSFFVCKKKPFVQNRPGIDIPGGKLEFNNSTFPQITI